MGFYKDVDIELDRMNDKHIEDFNDYEVAQDMFKSSSINVEYIDDGDDYEME